MEDSTITLLKYSSDHQNFDYIELRLAMTQHVTFHDSL